MRVPFAARQFFQTRGDGGQIRAIYYPNTAARAKDFCATTHSRIFSYKSSAPVRPRRSSELPQLHHQARFSAHRCSAIIAEFSSSEIVPTRNSGPM
jgi:hypothetical protein